MRLLMGVALLFVTSISANQISYDSDAPIKKQDATSPTADHFTLKYNNEEEKKPVQVTEAIYLNNLSKTILDVLSAFKMVTISDDIPKEGKEVIESSTGLQKDFTIGGITLFNPLTGLSFGIVTLVGILAFLGAGAASLLGFMVPPLQIANQILSIIALALFLAYYFEDKKYAPSYDYYDQGHSYGYDQGYDNYGSSSYSGYDRIGAAYPYDMSDIYKYTAGEALSEVTEKISDSQKVHDPHSYAMKLNKYQKKGTSTSESLSNQIGSHARSLGVSLFTNLGNIVRSGVKRMSTMMS